MFDRFDILEAWHLFLSQYHEGQSSEKYARLSKLSAYFEPRPKLSFSTLSENAQQIYLDLIEEEEDIDPERVIGDGYSQHWYRMWVCACAPQVVYIQANYFGDALETLMDWCDDHCIGAFVGVGEPELREAAEDLTCNEQDVAIILANIKNDVIGDVEAKVIEAAEADISMVGHTTLENWDYKKNGMPGIPSWAWGGDDVEPAIAALLNRIVEENECYE